MKRFLVLVAFGLVACVQLNPVATTAPDDPNALACSKDLRVICEVARLISTEYVDRVAADDIAVAAVRGVEEYAPQGTNTKVYTCDDLRLQSVCRILDERDTDLELGIAAALAGITDYLLDPYSYYLDPELLEIVAEETKGEFEGIGAMVTSTDLTSDDPTNSPCTLLSENCVMTIVSVFQGGPAESAGLQAGDRVTSVDGEGVEGRTLDEVTAKVRGPADTVVTLGIDRSGTALSIEITRAAIEIKVVETEMVGDIGYLRLNMFSDNSGQQVTDAIRSLTDGGARRLFFDLRGNPGGTLTAAIDVTSIFLDEGLVIRTEYPNEEKTYEVTGKAAAPDIDLVILLDGGSASASEVVAGALQEAGRALIVGEVSFGKNTVQSQFDLSNGGAMKLTVARWLTPGGADLGQGVRPDVELRLDAGLKPLDVVDRVLDAITITVAGSPVFRVQ